MTLAHSCIMPPRSFSKFFSLVRAQVFVAVNATRVWRNMRILCISTGDSGFSSSRYMQHLNRRSLMWAIHRRLEVKWYVDTATLTNQLAIWKIPCVKLWILKWHLHFNLYSHRNLINDEHSSSKMASIQNGLMPKFIYLS